MAPMLKPFAVSRREQFTLVMFVLNAESTDRAERKSRRQLWEEMGVLDLKRKITKAREPLSAEAEKERQERLARDPRDVDPDDVWPWQWASEEPDVRVALHQSTIDYVVKKLEGKIPGGATSEVLGELAERLVALRDTDAASITKKAGGGYKLPVELLTPEEQTAYEPLKAVPKDEPAAG